MVDDYEWDIIDDLREEQPEEGDYVSYDGGHSWFESGHGEIVRWQDDTNRSLRLLRVYADLSDWYPNGWLVSDHGNPVSIEY